MTTRMYENELIVPLVPRESIDYASYLSGEVSPVGPSVIYLWLSRKKILDIIQKPYAEAVFHGFIVERVVIGLDMLAVCFMENDELDLAELPTPFALSVTTFGKVDVQIISWATGVTVIPKL